MAKDALREQDLAQLWQGGLLPAAAIVTLDGTPLQIVYRGRPNSGAGPDFRDAVIALPDGRLLHGDVELHVRASDFRRHGHHQDPGYNRVVLHVVYRADDGVTTRLKNGRLASVIALERWLAARAAELEAMLRQPALWREPCQEAVERMGIGAVDATLTRLGERRLRLKAAAAARRPPTVELHERLLRSLGQGPQRSAWIELARRVPPTAVARAIELDPSHAERSVEALLLGAGRLLDSADNAAETGDAAPYLAELRRLWRLQGAPAGPPISVGGPRRPANHPARRLAGVARLLADGPEALLARLRLALLAEQRPEREVVRVLTVAAEGPWRERVVPWGNPSTGAPAGLRSLIGSGKALELALNAALPVILGVAEREGEQRLAEGVLRTFHALPSPPAYARTAHLYRALMIEGKSLIRGADQSQAALHLYGNYCTRGGCGRCPLS